VSLKIRYGKNLRTDFAIYSGVGDFANFYDFIILKIEYTAIHYLRYEGSLKFNFL